MSDYVVSDDDKEYIRTYVAQAPDVEAKKHRRRECAAVFGLSIPQVAAITAHTVIRAKRAQASNIEGGLVVEERPGMLMPAGTAMDYDNPVKQKYRTTLKNFILKLWPDVEDRRQKKMLFLPGRKCLEAHVYLDLGFTPGNLVGVESEASAFGEFLFNASKLGISVRTCDVASVVDEMEWDGVNLDYPGPIKNDVLTTLGNLRLNAKHKVFLGLNLLGQRESGGAQAIIDRYYALMKASSVIAKSENFVVALAAEAKIHEAAGLDKEDGKSEIIKYFSSEVDIADKRDEAIVLAVASQVGREYQVYNRISPMPNLEPPWQSDGVIQMLVAMLFKCLWKSLNKDYFLSLEDTLEITHKLLQIYKMAMAPHHAVTYCEQYSYVSPSHQKFLTDLYALDFCRPYGSNCDELVRFVNNGIEALAREPKSWGFQIRDRKGCVWRNGKNHRIANSDTLEMVADGCVVSRLNFRTMHAALDRMNQVVVKDISIKAIHQQHQFDRRPL